MKQILGLICMWIESLQYKVKMPRAYELPYSQKSHTRLTAAKRGKEFGRVVARELAAQGRCNGKRGGLPHLYFIGNNVHQNTTQ